MMLGGIREGLEGRRHCGVRKVAHPENGWHGLYGSDPGRPR